MKQAETHRAGVERKGMGGDVAGLAFDGLLNDLQQCRQEHHGIINGQETLR